MTQTFTWANLNIQNPQKIQLNSYSSVSHYESRYSEGRYNLLFDELHKTTLTTNLKALPVIKPVLFSEPIIKHCLFKLVSVSILLRYADYASNNMSVGMLASAICLLLIFCLWDSSQAWTKLPCCFPRLTIRVDLISFCTVIRVLRACFVVVTLKCTGVLNYWHWVAI